MPRPESIPLPAADAVTFRPGFWRAFGATAAISAVPSSVCLLTVLAVAPAMPAWVWLLLCGNAVAGSCAYATGFAVQRWRRCRDWLRISSAGLELSSRGSSPLMVRWPAVESVCFTRRWGTPLLDVTLAGTHGVAVLTGDASTPRIRTRDGRDTVTVEIWLFRPGRAAMRSALARHLPSGSVALGYEEPAASAGKVLRGPAAR